MRLEDDRYTVPGLERGLRLLGEFSRHDKTLSAPELARRLDVPRSTVFRLLATLERLGFVQRADGSHEYRLGMAVLRMGFEYLASLELTEVGRPVLERLRESIAYSTSLAVRDGRAIVYVAKSVMPEPFASAVNVGARLPAHASVLGRVLLQELDLPALQDLYPETPLKAYSEQTPPTVAALYELLRQDRTRGYVAEQGFLAQGVCTVAAPVRNRSGHVVAALGATIPGTRIDPGQLDFIVAQVRASAAELSQLIN